MTCLPMLRPADIAAEMEKTTHMPMTPYQLPAVAYPFLIAIVHNVHYQCTIWLAQVTT